MRPHFVFFLLGCLLLTPWAQAYDFAEEDAAFLRRGEASATDLSPLSRAIELYRHALLEQELDLTDLIYAHEQISRLYAFQTQMVLSRGQIMSAALACIENVGAIKPGQAGIPENPAYYYWLGVCRLAWSNLKQDLTALRYAPTLAALIAKGQALSASYEGGGFARLEGIFYANLPDTNLLGGPDRDWPRAFSAYGRSLQSDVPFRDPKNPTWMEPTREAGRFFYQTHYYYADSLAQNGQDHKACRLLSLAVSHVSAGEFSEGRSAEAQLASSRMENLQEKIGCSR